MKRGFTLLELIIVIIIIGVLATLGFTQYSRLIEKSRGAEARTVLGSIRTMGAAYRLEHGNAVANFSANDAGIGGATDQIPSGCTGTHYFSYAITATSGDTLTVTATRCTGSGKAPQGPSANTLTLTTNYGSGVDTWTSSGGY